MKKEIHNIFSKKNLHNRISICPNPNTKIIMDTREKQSLIAANLIEQKANIKFEKLDIGDYLIQDTIIERKTFSDFISSMISKRLQEQLINLKKYPKQYLLLEGFYYNYNDFKIHENAIKGMLISIATDFKIPIIYTENETDTSKFLILTAKRYEKKKQLIPLRHLKNSKSFEKQKQFILEGFPGVGPTIAQELLKKYETLENIFKTQKKELEKINKFDKNKIKEFKKLLEK
jgi:Fanconi anemia group M protein